MIARLASTRIGCHELAASGGINQLVRTLERYAASPHVVAAALAAVAAMTQDGATISVVLRSGCMRHVAAALRTHTAVAATSRIACVLMCIFACNDSNRLVIAEEGAIPLVVRVLAMHARDAGIASPACMTLQQMTANDSCRAAVVAAGGIDRVLAALRAHEDSAEVVRVACAALQALAACNESRVAVAVAGPFHVSWLLWSDTAHPSLL